LCGFGIGPGLGDFRVLGPAPFAGVSGNGHPECTVVAEGNNVRMGGIALGDDTDVDDLSFHRFGENNLALARYPR